MLDFSDALLLIGESNLPGGKLELKNNKLYAVKK